MISEQEHALIFLDCCKCWICF